MLTQLMRDGRTRTLVFGFPILYFILSKNVRTCTHTHTHTSLSCLKCHFGVHYINQLSDVTCLVHLPLVRNQGKFRQKYFYFQNNKMNAYNNYCTNYKFKIRSLQRIKKQRINRSVNYVRFFKPRVQSQICHLNLPIYLIFLFFLSFCSKRNAKTTLPFKR